MTRQSDELAAALKRVRELEKCNARLEASNRLFDGVVSRMPVVFFRLDANGVFTESMGAGLQRLGLKDGQAVGRNALEDYPKARDDLERSLAGATGVYEVVGGTAEDPWHFITYSAFDETAGSGLIAFSIDTTERYLSERASQRIQHQLQRTQKLESLGLLAGGIAHDFNNLLIGILGNASLMRMDVAAGARFDRELASIESAAQRAAELCQQLLAYSGKGRFVVQPIDLSDIVHSTAELLEISIPKTVRLFFALAPEVLGVEADVTQLRQVVMNLVVNAAEAIEPKNPGSVTLATGQMTCDAEYLSTSLEYLDLEPGDYNYLEVSDNGRGMDAATIAQLFDPFFTTKIAGHGLGMAAVRGIVRGHGGAIRVYSEVGKGTTVKILLPSTSRGTATIGSEAQDDAVVTGEGTVLIVDDEPIVIQMASAALERCGYDVLTASNGEEALELYRERGREIDIILLDMTMPGIDGEEVFRRLRTMHPGVRVVLSSGYNEQDATNHLAGKGLAGFIQKPYRASKLLRVVNAALGDDEAPATPETGGAEP